MTALTGGGIERSMLNLAEKLSLAGVKVDIVCLRDKIDYTLDRELYSVHFVSSKNRMSENSLINYIKYFILIRNKVNKIQSDGLFDLSISNTYEVDRLVKFLALRNVYYYMHVLKSITFNKSFIKRSVFKFIYKGENLLTVSKGLRHDVISEIGVKAKSIEVVYNSFNFKKIHAKANENIDIKEGYIIHIGRFCNQKRHDVLIKAFARASIKEKLILLGAGHNNKSKYMDDLRCLIYELGVADRVVFKGYDENPYKYISKAKALVLSSDYEGMPMVIVESLILKTPVVSTDCKAGPNELLVDRLSSFLSPVGDIDKLADNIRSVVENPPTIKDKYTKRFDDNLIVENFLSKLGGGQNGR